MSSSAMRLPLRAITLTTLVAGALAACGGGGKPPTTPTGEGGGAAADTRTPFERRLDAACDAVGERLTRCAVEDAQARLAAGQTTQAEFDATTKPEVLAENSRKWHDTCFRRDRSSRQVRVLEVCVAEEAACEPLVACLENLNAPEPGAAPASP